MLEFSHDGLLVAASLAVALMAGFTGLSLLRGASAMPVARRKLAVAMAAVALGGGIWSMHFVAMLGLQLPILFYYDALITLISALVAILMTGAALILLHFGPRGAARITAAGAVLGLGIPTMHYIGMSAMQLCRPVYTTGGVAAAGAASLALSVAAVWIAYGGRSSRNILIGTVGFGLAVFSVHFIAMAGTGFQQAESAGAGGPLLANTALAFLVTLAVFVISGAFLLTGATFLPEPGEEPVAAPLPAPVPAPVVLAAPVPVEAVPAETVLAQAVPAAPAAAPAPPVRAGGVVPVPYEREGRTRFIDHTEIAAIRAEGHYSVIYAGADRFFCPWSISEAEARLPADAFLRAHRSYLINPRHVSAFERTKDTGVCFFERTGSLAKVPVSRSRLPEVRAALGL